MDVTRLRHAVAVARMGSLTAAAASIPLSQPALSRSIQALEREYGLRLFERGRNGARLTPEGARFISKAEGLVTAVDAGEADLRSLGDGSGRPVSLGLAPMTAAMLAPRLINVAVNSTESLAVRVVVDDNRRLRDRLWAGDLDFYIGSVPQDPGGFAVGYGLRLTLLPDVSADLLVRAGHPLLASPDPRSELGRYPLFTGAFVRSEARQSILESVGLPLPVVEMEDYGELALMTSRTDALLLASVALARLRPDFGLVRLPVDLDESKSGYAVISREARPLVRTAQRLAGRLASIITTSGAFQPAGGPDETGAE